MTTIKVGDRVRLTRMVRHDMIPVGSVGEVVEIVTTGAAPGVSIEFMRKPSPEIARIFGKDPNVAEPFRVRFSFSSRWPFEIVGAGAC
jgi:hypothetical protein